MHRIPFSHKKEFNYVITAPPIELEYIRLSDISQAKNKNYYHMVSLTYRRKKLMSNKQRTLLVVPFSLWEEGIEGRYLMILMGVQ